jgi:hypothetical protein
MSARFPGPARVSLALAIALLAALVFAPSQSEAKSAVEEFLAKPSDTQAGGHPDMLFQFKAGNRATQGFPSRCYCEDPKDITVSAPTGVVGAPSTLPQCSASNFLKRKCSPDAQIGIQVVALGGNPEYLWFVTPLYNLEPRPDQVGLLGFLDPLASTPNFLEISSRTESDYGVDTTAKGITHFIPPNNLRTILWGVPAAQEHEALRFPLGSNGGGCSNEKFESLDPTPFVFGEGAFLPNDCTRFSIPAFEPTPTNSTPRPFVSNPTTCGVPLTATIETLAYDNLTDNGSYPWPATTGCDQLAFNPSLSAVPTTDQTDTASGLDVKLSVPQGDSPSVPASSQIRGTTVDLPDGFSINPNAADGKTACTDREGAFGTRNAPICPEFSKVGTASLISNALPGEIFGGIYLGTPEPGNPYRIFLTASGFGTNVKLEGSVKPDPSTGRITVAFEDLPQSPLTEFNLHFFGSERGLLATPTHCGTYPVDTTFEPWNDALPDQTSRQFFVLKTGPNGAPCPGAVRPFTPDVQTGMTDNTAGKHAAFHLTVSRPDGDQILTGLDVNTPPGFSATLKGIPYCSAASLAQLADPARDGLVEQAAPACSPASRIGTALAGVGAGSHPFYAPGAVYLAGPYRGAPLSLVVVVPAISGPYDLGNVVVRAAIEVDPRTAQVTAASDPIPQILDGIPLRIRSIRVSLDRPGFTLNPTSCEPFSVSTSVFGDQGGLATVQRPFQVANCIGLPFGPKLSISLTGATRRTGHPALRAILTSRPGEANIARTSVTLPSSTILDNSNIQNPCTRVQFAASACPESSRIGTARADSPLLAQPLQGPVYLRSSSNKLPDLVADLRGQIDIELAGRIDSVKKRLRTTFTSVPDVPVSRFSLELEGGKDKGLLSNSANLCKAGGRVAIKMEGQNGDSVKSNPKPKTSCGKSKG